MPGERKGLSFASSDKVGSQNIEERSGLTREAILTCRRRIFGYKEGHDVFHPAMDWDALGRFSLVYASQKLIGRDLP